MRRAVSLQPHSPLVRYSLSTLLREQGSLADAASEFRRTLRLLDALQQPGDPHAEERRLAQLEGPLFGLAQVLRRLGSVDEANRALARFHQVSDRRNRLRRLRVRAAKLPDHRAVGRQAR